MYDGAEINEAVLTLLHLAKAGAQVQCFAPDQEQFHTINHMTVKKCLRRAMLWWKHRVLPGQYPATHLTQCRRI